MRFESFDGVEIAYEVMGEGDVVLLHHGFASESQTNWVRPGVADAIVAIGRRVVLVDARGHGKSEKPHDPAAYADQAMARDVRALLDHLDVETVDYVGYSMGSFVGMHVAIAEPRLRSLVLGGAGLGQIKYRRSEESLRIAEALEAADPSVIENATARAFRNFAEATGADRLALAAIQRSGNRFPSVEDLEGIQIPTLVVSGEKDTLVGPPGDLAAHIPGARSAVVPGDHLSAVVKPEFRLALVAFLESFS